MTYKKLRILSLTVALGFALTAQAGTLNPGAGVDFTVNTNWSDNTLPTNPLDPGIIDSNSTDATWTGDANGLAIRQTGGLVETDGSGWGNSFENVTYEITGGTLDVTGWGLRMRGGSTLTIDGGTVTMGDTLTINDSTVNMLGGTLTAQNLQTNNNAIWNFSGGAVDLTNQGFTQSGKSSGTSQVNFSGNVDFNTTNFQKGNATAINFEIGSGSGTIDADTITSSGLSFNWLSGSGFSFTATTIDGGSTWEDLWNAGVLTVDSGQSGTFASNFNDVGGTLTLIPEPSTFALLGLAGLAALFLRRRR